MKFREKSLTVLSLAVILASSGGASVLAVSNNSGQKNVTLASEIGTELKARRSELTELKQKNGEELVAAKQKAAEQTKGSVLKSIDSLEDRLTRMRDRAKNIKTITEPQKLEIYGKIDAEIASLEQEKVKLQNAQSSDQIKSVMLTVKAQVRVTHQIGKDIVAMINKYHYQVLNQKLNQIILKLQDKVNTAQLSEEDKTTAEGLLSQANNLMGVIETKMAAKDYVSVKQSEKQVHSILVQVVKILTASQTEE